MSEVVATKAKELLQIVPEDIHAELFTDDEKINDFLGRMHDVVNAHQPDVSTASGRDEIKSLAFGVSKAKTKLDKQGKAITENWRQKTAKVNAARKKITTELDALRDKARKPVTEWEEAKAAREAQINERIKRIDSYRLMEAGSSEVLQGYLNELTAIEIDESFEHLRDDAYATHKAAFENVRARLKSAKEQEAKDAELEELRAEKAKRDAEEQERLAKERAAQEEAERKERERIRAEEEAARIAAAAEEAKVKAEREAQEAIERAKREAEAKAQAEKDRIAKLEAEQAAKVAAEAEAQRKRDENIAHRKRVNNKAAKAFMTGAGVDQSTAETIVTLIVSGAIPNISIQY